MRGNEFAKIKFSRTFPNLQYPIYENGPHPKDKAGKVHLSHMGYADVAYLQQKQFENEQCLRYLGERFSHIDSLDDQSRLLEVARGFLAGNVFDWGAKEVAAIMEKGEFSFGEAQSRLQGKSVSGGT